MVRTYTTRADKEDLLLFTVRSVYKCLNREIPDRIIFDVEQTFEENIRQARDASTTDMRLQFARSVMQTWTPTSHTTGLAAITRRLVLEDRVDLLKSILDNWGVERQWRMQDGNLSFPFPVDRDTASQTPTPRVSNRDTAGGPGYGASQLNRMLLQLKQLSS